MPPKTEFRGLLALVTLAGTSGAAQAQMYTDTFEMGVNMGGWTLGCKKERIEYWNGYSGAYLRGDMTGVPEMRTRGASVFTGDWSLRPATIFCFAMGVYERTGPNVPLSLVLRTDNGTPQDPEDDWAAFISPPNQLPPEPGEPWLYISYLIPNLDQAAPPPRWRLMNIGSHAPVIRDWRVLMRNISEIKVMFGAPGLVTPSGTWAIGVDDVRVEPVANEGPCYPNCDHSSVAPILNANDFQCFMIKFAAQDPYANCDGSTNMPALTANDFQCFLHSYAAGCT